MDGITNGPHAGDPPTVLQSADAVELNRALAEAQERIRALEAVIEADRTRIIDGVNTLEKVLRGRFWLTEGRGSYEWNDDRYRKEFGDAARAVLKAVEPLRKIGADLTNCPPTTDEVIAARRNKDARIEELERVLQRLAQMPDCGCNPCRGQCRTETALLIDLQERCDFARAVLATPAPEHPDTRRLEWLAHNLAYLMMVNPSNNVMYTLPNRGRGWKDNELRAAIDAAMKEAGNA